MNMREYAKPLAITLLICAMIYLSAVWIIEVREQRCAEKCQNAGASGYEYKGFSGSGRALGADSCKCIN